MKALLSPVRTTQDQIDIWGQIKYQIIRLYVFVLVTPLVVSVTPLGNSGFHQARDITRRNPDPDPKTPVEDPERILKTKK